MSTTCAAATLIRQQTLERGLDPRDFVLYSYGGAGPVHAFGYAAEIGVREVLIPLGNGASTLSAYGIAAGDLARFVEVETALQAPFDDAALSRGGRRGRGAARQSMLDAGVAEDPQIDVWALMRYQEQLMHRLEVPLDPADRGGHRPAVEAGRAAGGAVHAGVRAPVRRFRGVGVPGGRDLRAPGPGRACPRRTRAIAGTAASAPGIDDRGAATRTVPVFWPDAGEHLATTVYDGDAFTDGGEITGPALVELPHTTIAVPRAASLTAGPRALPPPAARSRDGRKGNSAMTTVTWDGIARGYVPPNRSASIPGWLCTTQPAPTSTR